jgi:predicted O-methyltransferase YrrM
LERSSSFYYGYFFSERTIGLVGRDYRVTYDTRRAKAERDYLVLKELARGKNCVFDIGANIGLTSLVMASSLGVSGHIYAFEASEAACHIISETYSDKSF